MEVEVVVVVALAGRGGVVQPTDRMGAKSCAGGEIWVLWRRGGGYEYDG